jgi:hypothetical protein
MRRMTQQHPAVTVERQHPGLLIPHRTQNSSSTGLIDGRTPLCSRHTRRTATSNRSLLSMVSRSRMVPNRGAYVVQAPVPRAKNSH